MARKEEENGGELGGSPNKKYEQFFAKFPEIETLDLAQWKTVHIIAYFCKKYQDQYHVKYQFKFNSPNPSQSFETFQVKKLASMLSANPKILKEYIDWVYKTRVVEAKRRLTSIGFMTVETLVNDYKFNVLLSEKTLLNVDRSTLLPSNYVSIFADLKIKVNTYGDLSFLYQMTDKSPELDAAFSKIAEMGFNLDILMRII